MFKYKNPILIVLLLFFLFFSFYPTLYEISQSPKLKIKNRDFILEHNYYWPDFNLYLSKVRQGYENRWLAVEKYTDAIFDEKLKGMATPISQKSQELITKLVQDK